MNATTRLKLAVAMAILLGSCASTPDGIERQGYLATQITDDGSKKFVYTLDYPVGGNDGQRASGNGRPGNTTGHIYGNSSRGVTGGVTIGSSNRRGSGQSRSGRSKSSRQAQLNEQLEKMLVQELNQTGFCQGGYMELERSTKPPDVLIRGECDETATSLDRANFPND